MNSIVKPFVLLLLFLSYSLSSNAGINQLSIPTDLNHHCTELKQSRDARFCITESKTSQNDEVIFFFHPRGGSVDNWINGRVGEKLRSEWKKNKLGSPRIVTVSFGKISILVKKNSKSRSGLLETFYSEVLPVIEKELYSGKKPTSKPSLLGFSMGGFNALQVYFYDQSNWKKLALINPAISIPEFTPFISDKKLRELARAKGLKFLSLYSAKIHGKLFFENLAQWMVSSPLELAKKNFKAHSPEVLLNCGTNDRFGFHLGCQELSKIASSLTKSVKLRLKQNGTHGEFDAPAIASFLNK